MTKPLSGQRILLVEDDFLIALDIADILQEAGAEVIGPVGFIDEALQLLSTLEQYPNMAVLDLDLHGSRSYPIAEALGERGVRVLFTTGFGQEVIAPQYRQHVRLEKPISEHALLAALTA